MGLGDSKAFWHLQRLKLPPLCCLSLDSLRVASPTTTNSYELWASEFSSVDENISPFFVLHLSLGSFPGFVPTSKQPAGSLPETSHHYKDCEDSLRRSLKMVGQVDKCVWCSPWAITLLMWEINPMQTTWGQTLGTSQVPIQNEKYRIYLNIMHYRI